MIRRSDKSPADKDGSEEPVRLKRFDEFDLLLGDIMRGERATLGKSLLDVQRDLKIKATYIAAIENTDPSAFESPGFVAGYVRSYARYLGLDPEWAFETFCREGNFTVTHNISSKDQGKPASKGGANAGKGAVSLDPLANPNVSFIPEATSSIFSGFEPRAIGSLVVLLALMGGLGYGGWSVLQEVQRVEFTPVDQAPGVASTIGGLDTSLNVAELDDSELDPVTPRTEALDRLYRPQALDVPVLVARDGPISALDPSQNGRFAPGSLGSPVLAGRDVDAMDQTMTQSPFGDTPSLEVATAELEESSTVQVVEDGPPEVSLFAVRPSWVRVRAADGTVVFEKILDAGERFTLPQTEEPHVLRAGNAGSLYFDIDGETFGPAGDGPAVVRNVSLADADIRGNYSVADLEQDADLKRLVNVAEANSDN